MSEFGFRVEEAEVAPGTLGLLYDETPLLTMADVRPFIWAILLYRGAVKSHEVVAAITPLCAHSELYSGWSDHLDIEDNRTRLEWLVGSILGEMTGQGLLRYSTKGDLWVLNSSDRHLPEVITAVAGVNGSMPQHYLYERGNSEGWRKA